MADVHRFIGLAGIAVAAVALAWSVIIVAARREAGRPYLVGLAVVVIVAVAAAVGGLILLLTGPGPADPLHIVYGAIAVLAIPAGIAVAAGRTPRRQSIVLLVAVLVELGVTVRLLQTG